MAYGRRGNNFGGLISSHTDASRPRQGSWTGGRGGMHARGPEPTEIQSALNEIFEPRYQPDIGIAYQAIRELVEVIAQQKETLEDVVTHINRQPAGGSSTTATSNPRSNALAGKSPSYRPKEMSNPRTGGTLTAPRESNRPSYRSERVEEVETYEAKQRKIEQEQLAEAAEKERNMVKYYTSVNTKEDGRFSEVRDLLNNGERPILTNIHEPIISAPGRLSDVVGHNYKEHAPSSKAVGFTGKVIVVKSNLDVRKDLYMANLHRSSVNEFTKSLKGILEDGSINDFATYVYASKLNELLTNELNTYLDAFYHLKVESWVSDFFDLYEVILGSFGEDSATLFSSEVEELYKRVVLNPFKTYRDTFSAEEWGKTSKVPFLYSVIAYYTDRFAIEDGLIDLPENTVLAINPEDDNLSRIISCAIERRDVDHFFVVTKDEAVIRIFKNRRKDWFIKLEVGSLF